MKISLILVCVLIIGIGLAFIIPNYSKITTNTITTSAVSDDPCEELYQLVMGKQGYNLGEPEYDARADIDKDNEITLIDAIEVDNHQLDGDTAWCSEQLSSGESDGGSGGGGGGGTSSQTTVTSPNVTSQQPGFEEQGGETESLNVGDTIPGKDYLWIIIGAGVLLIILIVILFLLKHKKSNVLEKYKGENPESAGFKEFVEDAKKKGYSDEEIKTSLKNSGWADDDIKRIKTKLS